jgi:hypothetical protein
MQTEQSSENLASTLSIVAVIVMLIYDIYSMTRVWG